MIQRMAIVTMLERVPDSLRAADVQNVNRSARRTRGRGAIKRRGFLGDATALLTE
jgi:hypothetical protein